MGNKLQINYSWPPTPVPPCSTPKNSLISNKKNCDRGKVGAIVQTMKQRQFSRFIMPPTTNNNNWSNLGCNLVNKWNNFLLISFISFFIFLFDFFHSCWSNLLAFFVLIPFMNSFIDSFHWKSLFFELKNWHHKSRKQK